MEHSVLNSSNYTFDDDHITEYYVNIYVIDVILLVTNVIGLASNGIILYVICKTRSWKTPVYAFVSSWAVMDILHLITSPGLLKWYKQIHDIYQDFTLQTVYVCLNVAFEFGIILILFVVVYLDTIQFFKTNGIKTIAFIWSVVGVFCICAFIGIADHSFLMSIIFSLALYAIFIIVITVTCITFIVQKRYLNEDFKLSLAMVCTYVCFALSFALAAALMTVFGGLFVLPREIVLLIFAMGEMDALANLYLLTKFNRTFNIYFYRLFDCRRNKHDDKVNIVYEHQTEEDV